MKRTHFLMICVAMLIACALPSTSNAQQMLYTGTQVWLSVSGETPIKNKHGEALDRIGLRGQIVAFMVPSEEVIVNIFYAGPTFTPISSSAFDLWISPQVAIPTVGKFKNTFAIGPSLMVKADIGRFLSVFLEFEAYLPFNGDVTKYYGYYAGSLHPTRWLDVGGQAEQNNDGFIGGPHIGVHWGPTYVNLEYYFGSGSRGGYIVGTHALRVSTGLRF